MNMHTYWMPTWNQNGDTELLRFVSLKQRLSIMWVNNCFFQCSFNLWKSSLVVLHFHFCVVEFREYGIVHPIMATLVEIAQTLITK